jgi:chaperone LolA
MAKALRRARSLSALLLLSLCAPLCLAAEPSLLQRFLASTRSFSADFTLESTSASGKATRSSGKIEVQKPGKFRWEIDEPAPQLMACDGKTLWFYDKGLNQASRRPASEALPGTPAALLAGDAAALARFSLSDGGTADGLHWTKAIPKDQSAGFSELEAGFDAQGRLQALRFVDALGQHTLLLFQRQKHNPALPASRFAFTPPPGTDILAAPGGQ